MSYYFGTILKNSVLFASDRTINDKISGINRSTSKRYSIFGDNRVFLPTGNMSFCVGVRDLFHNAFSSGLALFQDMASICPKLLSSDYRKMKEDNIARLQAIGKTGETENVDCLYGGLDENGVPFIISLSSVDDFRLKLVNKPPQYVCLNQSPPILEYVAKTLKAFMGTVADKGTEEVWNLGRKFLPSIIQKISKADPLVSLNGDLIFVSNSGVQTFEFGKKEKPTPEAEFLELDPIAIRRRVKGWKINEW